MTITHRPNFYLILTLLTSVICYYQGLSGDYVFDDVANLLNNDFILNSAKNFDILGILNSGDAGPLKRPISVLSFAINSYFTGLDPFPIKLTNLVIHLINGLLIYVISGQLFKRLINEQSAQWLGLTVASIFLIHPLTLTNILYAVQRMNSLSTLFALLGILLYIKGRVSMTQDRNGLGLACLGVVVCGAMSAFSKENGLLLPFFCLLLEIIFFKFAASHQQSRLLLKGMAFALVVIPIIYVLYKIIQNPNWMLGGFKHRPFTLHERILTESRVLFLYLRMIFLPDISLMGLYHDDIALSKSLWSPITTVFSVVGIVGLIGSALVLIRKAPVYSFGVLFFFIGHSLESTIFPLEIAHEHRNYLPMFGPVFAGVYYSAKWIDSVAVSFKVILTASVIGFLAVSTSIRAEQWSNLVTHALTEVTNHPESFRANYQAGRMVQKIAHSGLYPPEEAYQEAMQYLTKAYQLKPDDAGALLSLIHASYIADLEPQYEWYPKLFELLKTRPIHNGSYNIISAFTECTIAGKCKPTSDQMDQLYNTALYNPLVKRKGKAAVLIAAAKYYASLGDYKTTINYLYFACDEYDQFQTRLLLTKTLISLNLKKEALEQIALMKQKGFAFFHKDRILELEKEVAINLAKHS